MGRILSEPISMQSNGVIRHLFLKPDRKRPMRLVSEVTAISEDGLENDANRGRRLRQVLLIEQETLLDFGLAPGDVRENIVVSGISLTSLLPKVRLQAGEALLEVTMDCAPCSFLDELRPGLQTDMDGRRGTLCRVIDGGIIRVGDSISLTSWGQE